jgi:hypothetical protein
MWLLDPQRGKQRRRQALHQLATAVRDRSVGAADSDAGAAAVGTKATVRELASAAREGFFEQRATPPR